MSGVVVEVVEDNVVVESFAPAPSIVYEVLLPGLQGLQGVPGDTRVWIGSTPPSDTSMIWVDTSLTPPGSAGVIIDGGSA